IQGTRDVLGPLDVVKPVVEELPGSRLEVIAGGDHSFKVRKMDGRDQQEVFASLVEIVAEFAQSLRTGGGT
ncbi:MAG: alpha/beta hydrolase, partial [Acidimicrobiia bacterium]|nr:alpha/beta hydrolase [Acidimicrobiia bacterium]